jgi:hypothetical protein
MHLSRKVNSNATSSHREAQVQGRGIDQATREAGVMVNHDRLVKEVNMTTQAGIEQKERDFLAQCVGDAYQMLDVMPGVEANGPALVWLAEQFVLLRRGDCPPAHAMTL